MSIVLSEIEEEYGSDVIATGGPARQQERPGKESVERCLMWLWSNVAESLAEGDADDQSELQAKPPTRAEHADSVTIAARRLRASEQCAPGKSPAEMDQAHDEARTL